MNDVLEGTSKVRSGALPQDHSILERLASGAAISERVVVLVAHPDDETLGMGGRLAKFQRLTLVHATNGAPPGGANAVREGFTTLQAYSSARFGELTRSLRKLGARPQNQVRYDCTDSSCFGTCLNSPIASRAWCAIPMSSSRILMKAGIRITMPAPLRCNWLAPC